MIMFCSNYDRGRKIERQRLQGCVPVSDMRIFWCIVLPDLVMMRSVVLILSELRPAMPKFTTIDSKATVMPMRAT